MDAGKSRERVLGRALRTQPDRRLVALARDGSERAQEEIVRRYRPALVRYAGSIVGAAAAEDVVQDSLTKSTRALARVDEDLRLRPWLYAIVRNTALNHLRDAGPATEQLDENYDGVEQPPQALERRERVRSLVGGLRRLPDPQREALVKRELEGRSHEEIGAELGVSTGAARQLIFRARESLRVGFGSLLPMPLLRWLAESGGDGVTGVAAGAGGGALAAKAAVAVFAAGAAVTAGVAIDHGGHQRAATRPQAVVKPATVERLEESAPPAGGHGPVTAEPASSEDHGPDGGGGPGRSGHRGPGGGSGDELAVDDHGSGPGPSDSSGPGSDGGARSGSDGEDHDGHRSGHGGSGSSGGGEDRSGSSHSGDGSSGSGGDDGGTSHGGSGSSGSGGSSGRSGSSESGSSGSSGGRGTSGGGGGGGDDFATPPPSPAPAPPPPTTTAPEAIPEESSSGSSGGPGGGETSSESSRDLSGDAVSQGSDDPN